MEAGAAVSTLDHWAHVKEEWRWPWEDVGAAVQWNEPPPPCE